MKVLKYIIITFVFCCAALSSFAAPANDSTIVDRLNNSPGVNIDQPAALNARLVKGVTVEVSKDSDKDKNTSATQPKQSANGRFSIEIFSGNGAQAKNQANARRRNVGSRFPQYNTRLVYDAPFWRVRAGNFTSRNDAEAAMADIRRAFPSYSAYLRVVGR